MGESRVLALQNLTLNKKIGVPINSKWQFENCCSQYGNFFMTVTVHFFFFWRILQLSSAHEFSYICESQNPLKIALHSNCHSTAPATVTHVLRCHIKDNGHTYMFDEMHFLTKCLFVALDDV